MGELEYTLGIDGVTRYVKVNSGGTDYYYEVEPIKWRILNYITLAADGNKALILSEKVLTRKAWHTDTTSNKNDVSMIRAWLNDGLYNTTFSTQQKGLIEQTMVDNSGGTTGYGSGNINACGNTYDNIFLLSWSQVMNSAYGFSSDEPRKKVLTDYSRKLGTKEVNGFAHWWLRSPYHSGTSQVRYIDEDGYIGDKETVTTSSLGVVPALVIDLT